MHPPTRKRIRSMTQNTTSPSINNSPRRQRRKLSPHMSSSVPTISLHSDIESSEEQSLSDDEDYIPILKTNNHTNDNHNTHHTQTDEKQEKQTKSSKTRRVSKRLLNKSQSQSNTVASKPSSSSSSSSDNDETHSVFQSLHWRKKQVPTPKFVAIKDNNHTFGANSFRLQSAQKVKHNTTPTALVRQQSLPTPANLSHVNDTNEIRLRRSQSTVDLFAIESDVIEDTSNEAYFYRHFRAEAREKLFYEELFASRLKQQQLLEAKEKRKKKKKPKRKKKHTKDKGKEIETETEGKVSGNVNEIEINLTLPTLPKGPWTYQLGPEYDKKPKVPSIVSKRPQFNYQLQHNRNRWQMPSFLIRRTDYGTMNQMIYLSESATNESNEMMKERKSIESEKKKKELISLYKQLKQIQNTSSNSIESKSKKHITNKKKNGKSDKRVSRSKSQSNSPSASTPIDIRVLLASKT